MTDETEESRKAIAISYLKSLDAGGVSPTTGLGLFDHFAEDAEVYFPKWGIARGKPEVIRMFTDVGGTLRGITHHYDGFTWYMTEPIALPSKAPRMANIATVPGKPMNRAGGRAAGAIALRWQTARSSGSSSISTLTMREGYTAVFLDRVLNRPPGIPLRPVAARRLAGPGRGWPDQRGPTARATIVRLDRPASPMIRRPATAPATRRTILGQPRSFDRVQSECMTCFGAASGTGERK